VVVERVPRHVGLREPRPPKQAPPEGDDWRGNGQIPPDAPGSACDRLIGPKP